MVGNDHVSSWGGVQGSSRDHAPGTCAATASPLPPGVVRVERIGSATLYLGDAAAILPALGRFDAVVTDPPYGIGEAAGKNASRSKPFKGAELRMPGKTIDARDYGDDDWDDAPIAPELMEQIRGAGRWNIIFGGNYYPSPATRCWLVWDKLNGNSDFADCELAWTNLPKAVRRLRYMWNGMLRANGEARGDHPTQKPIGVMKWALQQLPPGVATIIDPLMGSGTTGVAAVQIGLSFVGIEQRERYFEAACRRIAEAYAQPRLQLETALDERAPMRAAALPGMASETGEAA